MTYDDLFKLIMATVRDPAYEQTVPAWIALGEAVMNRELKDYRQVIRAQQSVSTPRIALPTDFGGPISVVLATGQHLQWVSPAAMAESKQNPSCVSGTPRTYTVIGNEFEFGPEPQSAVTVTLAYFQLIPALSSDVQTNWVLENHPDLYLYGALMHAPAEIGTDWAQKFAAAVGGAKGVRNGDGAWVKVAPAYTP